MLPKTLPGILIEGTDFIGKTTLAIQLSDRLRKLGVISVHRKCFLGKPPIVEALSDRIEGRSLEERDWLLTAAYLLDEISDDATVTFAVQERNWFSQVVRNEFFHDRKFAEYTRKIEETHFRFGTQIYLTSDIESKKRRVSGRLPKGPRDALLAADPQLHQRFDDYSRSRIPSHEKWQVIDTSDMPPDQLCELVIGTLGEL